MNKLVLFFLLIFSANIFPVDGFRVGTTSTSSFSFPSGYGIRLLNGFGNSGIYNNTANLGFMNPASIINLPDYSIGLSYQISTPVYYPEPFDDMSLPRVYNFIPQSFGAVYHYDDLSFGLSLGQEFNSGFEFGDIQVTTTQYPDGIGTVYTPQIENTIEKYSLSFAYNLRENIFRDAEVSIGLRYNLNRLHGFEKILNFEANNSIFGSSIDLALLCKMELFELGVMFKTGTSFSSLNENNRLTQLGNPGGTYKIETLETIFNTPPELSIDALFQIENNLKLSAKIDNIFWSTSNSFMDHQLDASSNLIFNFSDRLTGSAGLLLSNCFIDENYVKNDYNALFIMAGLILNYESFLIDFSLADSHLISGDLRKQTIGKLAIGITL